MNGPGEAAAACVRCVVGHAGAHPVWPVSYAESVEFCLSTNRRLGTTSTSEGLYLSASRRSGP